MSQAHRLCLMKVRPPMHPPSMRTHRTRLAFGSFAGSKSGGKYLFSTVGWCQDGAGEGCTCAWHRLFTVAPANRIVTFAFSHLEGLALGQRGYTSSCA